MKVGEWLRRYREGKGYTQQDMAEKCGISTPYISMIERNKNPQTGKPLNLSIDIYKKIAAGTGRNLAELAEEIDDIDLPKVFSCANAEEERILTGYRNLNYSNRHIFQQILTNFLTAQAAGVVNA